MSINRRLDNLEAAAKPDRGYVVLYCDPDGDYWDQTISAKDRRRVSEAEKQALELRHNVILVEYVNNWRSG